MFAEHVTIKAKTWPGGDMISKRVIRLSCVVCLLSWFGGCAPGADTQAHDSIIEQDLQNKQYELEILRELYVAQQHQDEQAFRYYVVEYVRVPRLKLTAEQKQHPDYKEWLSDMIIESGEFMMSKYDYIK